MAEDHLHSSDRLPSPCHQPELQSSLPRRPSLYLKKKSHLNSVKSQGTQGSKISPTPQRVHETNSRSSGMETPLTSRTSPFPPFSSLSFSPEVTKSFASHTGRSESAARPVTPDLEPQSRSHWPLGLGHASCRLLPPATSCLACLLASQHPKAERTPTRLECAGRE